MISLIVFMSHLMNKEISLVIKDNVIQLQELVLHGIKLVVLLLNPWDEFERP